MIRATTWAAAAAVVLLVLACAEAGVGADYHSRDPVACPAQKGAPNAQQAAQIFRCSTEASVGSYLVLTDNVKLQIGAARAFTTGDNHTDIDSSKPVYPIRGSWVEYQCANFAMYPAMGADSCRVYDSSNASGVCYQTSFGDWRCHMAPKTVNQRPGRVPPPK
ncbi:MAG TPA: hypothetical protein VMU01_06975 [Rhizomicrobium sp.]|nr:hypothetical protein [Rhizomicrobium sp.]